ncbi:MAG TPA: hypothetical protein VH559_01220, partial [Gemmatimonadaceae bacterium]
VNLLGSVTWAFEFEGQPYFDGFRDLATNGINKPVFNVFAMLGQMRGDRVSVASTGALPLDSIRSTSVRGRADISALASRDARSVSILVWNYHDDDLPAPPADVELSITGLPASRVTVTRNGVDRDHGNSYEKWKAMGSPQQPTPTQYREMEQASQLAELARPAQVQVQAGKVTIPFTLPRQGVTLLRVVW